MTDGLTIARSEFILGGQKSGKSRRAELLARDWLAQSTGNKAVLIATAQAWDEEMGERIARHQADRAQRVPGMSTLEEPLALAEAISLCSAPQTLVVVDCLTLWLTNLLMPASSIESADNRAKTASKEVAGRLVQAQQALLLSAIQKAAGPVVLVGNEIGLGVIPLGREVRAFVDALGCLNQEVANVCARVTLMAAGQSLVLKGSP